MQNSQEDTQLKGSRYRPPGDETRELLRALRSGLTEDDVPITEAAPAAIPAQREVSVPDVILAVLNSDSRRELVEVARMLSETSERGLIFHTAVGDIHCRINWRSAHPAEIKDELLIVKLRTSATTFIPKPGSIFEISFDDYAGRITVLCASTPCRLYPGVDLLCFIPQTTAMEKTGRLNEGAPSTVSGRPSDTVDAAGEPLVDGEKSAAVVKLPDAPAGAFDFIREP